MPFKNLNELSLGCCVRSRRRGVSFNLSDLRRVHAERVAVPGHFSGERGDADPAEDDTDGEDEHEREE